MFFFSQLASLVAQSLKTKNQSPYASNWLERLRKIKHLRSKVSSVINAIYFIQHYETAEELSITNIGQMSYKPLITFVFVFSY